MVKMSRTNETDLDASVSFEDQKKIQEFSKIHNKCEEYESEIKQYKNSLQNITDAMEEIALLDNEKPVPYSIGDCFFLSPLSEVEDNLERRKDELTASLQDVIYKIDECEAQLKMLKGELYARFGNNINLETE